MKREDVRALIIVTIELERLQDDACNEPHTLLHFAQEQRALIAELKLDASEPNNAKQSKLLVGRRWLQGGPHR